MEKWAVIIVLVVLLLFLLKNTLKKDSKKAEDRLKEICENEGINFEQLFVDTGVIKEHLSFQYPGSEPMKKVLTAADITENYFKDGTAPKRLSDFSVSLICQNCGHKFVKVLKRGTVVEQKETGTKTLCIIDNEEVNCPECTLNDIRKNF